MRAAPGGDGWPGGGSPRGFAGVWYLMAGGDSSSGKTEVQSPGELFPWEALARRRLALPSPTRDLIDPFWTDGGFLLALERFGYDGHRPAESGDRLPAALPAREVIDGIIDGECRAKLLALLLPRPQ